MTSFDFMTILTKEASIFTTDLGFPSLNTIAGSAL